VRWTLKLLREVWLNIGLEKVDTHEGVSVRALLDSGATGLFMSKKLAERQCQDPRDNPRSPSKSMRLR